MLSLRNVKSPHLLIDHVQTSTELYPDISLLASSGEILQIPRLLLASVSPHLSSLLHDVPVYPEPCLMMPDVKVETLLQLVSFLRSKELTFDSESSYISFLELMLLLGIDYESKCSVTTNADDEHEDDNDILFEVEEQKEQPNRCCTATDCGGSGTDVCAFSEGVAGLLRGFALNFAALGRPPVSERNERLTPGGISRAAASTASTSAGASTASSGGNHISATMAAGTSADSGRDLRSFASAAAASSSSALDNRHSAGTASKSTQQRPRTRDGGPVDDGVLLRRNVRHLEMTLQEAAACVLAGMKRAHAAKQFGIPASTLFDYMVRKGYSESARKKLGWSLTS